jgi:hypothetical protein
MLYFIVNILRNLFLKCVVWSLNICETKRKNKLKFKESIQAMKITGLEGDCAIFINVCIKLKDA